MAIKDALYKFLSTNSGVAALVSTRIYPNAIPQDAALPAIAYQEITAVRDYSHQGQNNTAEPLFQITIEAATYSTAIAVAAAVRAALSGYRGSVATSPATVIQGVFLENEYDGYNLDTDISTVRQDYRIFWKEV